MADLIKWHEAGTRYYETGVSKGVLYPRLANGTYPIGEAWNGLTAVNEAPSGADVTKKYADNRVYLRLSSVEEFNGTLEAFTYPDSFAKCDGSVEMTPGVFAHQQTRQAFGLCFRTEVENDAQDDEYKLHLVYNALAKPSQKNNQTLNESPETSPMSWELTTDPEDVPGANPSAKLTIDSRKADPAKLAALEVILYGVDNGGTGDVDGRLPLPAEVITLLTV